MSTMIRTARKPVPLRSFCVLPLILTSMAVPSFLFILNTRPEELPVPMISPSDTAVFSRCS